MKSAGNIAAAVGLGYVLGRKRKLRAAMVLGAVVAAAKLGKLPTGLLNPVSGVGGSHDSGLTGHAAAKLGSAGKAAAESALSRPVQMVIDRLNESAEALRQAGRSGEGR